MFWLIDNNIKDNYEFLMNFMDFETLDIDNNIIYVFNNIEKTNHNLSIICHITVKENIILYEFDGKQICFSFKTEEYLNESKIKYYYKKEKIEKMPRLLDNQYDFNDIITFNIDTTNEKMLIINENIKNNFRNYNII